MPAGTQTPPSARPLADLAKDAEAAIDVHAAARARHVLHRDVLMDAVENLVAEQVRRPAEKLAAIDRICGQDHPSKPGKKFSVSEADDFAQIDPAYAEYKARVALAERRRTLAETEVVSSAMAVEAARLRAELAIAVVRASVGAGL